ncbi:Dinucleotide-utilizing enzymes involved in molybdopterin and thiamine biosynthesis family 2 [Desulfurella amilsii]|uniref:Dinucleotide-utilizing enzymes involved in molybdopterin and thiamine biosynthesis family 2 n=1 Tax=Desulfurella amilsii TaxID=1562698 RepID=A0A1X4XV12_9BACT|nr:ThiF family adenylyltransferase [Desulfurella amilsii]OSS41364.1 Dinucleotide-utilizing enzymes involved in molybdopterin and thiamine biosynthesis family 2 [Desulfurella amilsii]
MSFFDRQIPILGHKCQEKIEKAKVFVGGVGGLGCIVSEMLVRVGIEKLYIADFDSVSQTNIHRQFLYTEQDIGKPKNLTAKAKLESIGTHCQVEAFGLIDENFELPYVDVVVDCFDNKHSKNLLSRLACQNHTYFVHAGVFGYFGQIATLKDKKLEEIFSFGEQKNYIIPQTVGIVASLQAMETIKLICSFQSNLLNKILSIDLLNYSLDTITLND